MMRTKTVHSHHFCQVPGKNSGKNPPFKTGVLVVNPSIAFSGGTVSSWSSSSDPEMTGALGFRFSSLSGGIGALNNLLSPIQTEPPSTQPRKRRNNAAQDLMFCRRQKRVKWSCYQDTITVEDYKLKEPIQSLKLWLPELNLAKSDRDILLNPTAWLTDSLIDAAQTLLKKANPAMQGLQSVTRGMTMNFDVEPGEFVQILHNGHGHWLTISCCSALCKAQIAALLATKQPAVELKFMDVQMQAGGYDCGLFTIAFATAIVFGKQPGLFCFDQPKMREHYRKYLEQGHITMFL